MSTDQNAETVATVTLRHDNGNEVRYLIRVGPNALSDRAACEAEIARIVAMGEAAGAKAIVERPTLIDGTVAP